jgi:hypothetical protein
MLRVPTRDVPASASVLGEKKKATRLLDPHRREDPGRRVAVDGKTVGRHAAEGERGRRHDPVAGRENSGGAPAVARGHPGPAVAVGEAEIPDPGDGVAPEGSGACEGEDQTREGEAKAHDLL